MSNGPEFGIDNPIGGISEPKSNKKLWIYGGLGCFGLMGLVCIGCTVAGYFALKPVIEFTAQNTSYVQTSEKAQAELGSPITLSNVSQSQDGAGGLEIRGTATGPKGSATYVIEAQIEGITPVRKGIYLEIDGERIDLDPDAELSFEVDDGSGQ